MTASLFAQLGGKRTLDRVHKIFYDKVYKDPVLKVFFDGIPQEILERQQTAFMTSKMGGGHVYAGRIPKRVHQHMFITDDLFDRRGRMLVASLRECRVSAPLIERWMRIDEAFRSQVTKKSLGECKKRFHTDRIITAPLVR